MPRRAGAMSHEAGRAMLSMAGIRILKQTSIAPGASANAAYTVTEPTTRRVIAIHLGTGSGDIRFKNDTPAAAGDIPIIPQRYFVIDAEEDDVLNFFNTTAGAITVYLAELD